MLVLYYGVAVVLQARDVAARGRVRAKVGVDVPACVACLCSVVEDHHVELGGQPAPVARHVCVVWGGDSRHAACVCVVYLSFFDLGWVLFGNWVGFIQRRHGYC